MFIALLYVARVRSIPVLTSNRCSFLAFCFCWLCVLWAPDTVVLDGDKTGGLVFFADRLQ
jgi:hypothetical protein